MKTSLNSILLTAVIAITATFSLQAGEIDPSQDNWYKHYKKQQNIPAAADMLINKDAEPDLKEGFTPLFNGKDLSGWDPKGGKCSFEAVGDTIVGTCVKGSPSTYLSSPKEYTDFIFTCDMKWEVDGNTGVMFRAQAKPGKKGNETVFGPQAEMEQMEKDRGWSGGIYGQSCGGWFYPLWLKSHAEVRASKNKDGWNRLTIQAKGNVVKTWVNGIPAAHWVNDTYKKGFFSLQIHSGKQGKIIWKNVKVKDLAK